MGYMTDKPIQLAPLPVDFFFPAGSPIGSAQTGTRADARVRRLPLLTKLVQPRPRTRLMPVLETDAELAALVAYRDPRFIRPFTNIQITVVLAVVMAPARRRTQAGAAVIVATPGRLLVIYLERGTVRLTIPITLVLDEPIDARTGFSSRTCPPDRPHCPRDRAETLLFFRTIPRSRRR